MLPGIHRLATCGGGGTECRGAGGLMAYSFKRLSEAAKADPLRRARIDEQKRALRDALALAQLRESRQMTQQQLAAQLRVSQANISRIEHQEDLYLSTLSEYIEALGGRLEITAVFDDESVALVSHQP